jgi:ComF family protein
LCHSCRAFIPDPGDVNLCRTCLDGTTPITSPLCNCCGRQFATFDGADHLCGACITDPPPFFAARAALAYAGTTRELIHSFKYSHKVMLRRPLGSLAGPCFDPFVNAFGADVMVPVPLHRKRLQERGFNQAVLLGEIFARRWGIPLVRNNLRRTRWTEPQINLTASARAENVKGAFSLADRAELAGERVLLIDDVYTTGSTVKECARVLGRGGAAAVAVLTIARAIE